MSARAQPPLHRRDRHWEGRAGPVSQRAHCEDLMLTLSLRNCRPSQCIWNECLAEKIAMAPYFFLPHMHSALTQLLKGPGGLSVGPKSLSLPRCRKSHFFFPLS